MSCILVNCVSARMTLGIMAFLMFFVTQMIRVNLYIAIVAMNDKARGNGTDQFLNETIWSDNKFSLFLGAFYWSYWATELPGGLLAQRFGGKVVMGVCVTIAAVLNFFLPAACNYHYLVASFLRALQGLALGVTWPVIHWLSARWIPQTERSKFMTSYHGAAVGTAITYPLSGLIITKYGWETVFYFVGFVTLAWCFAWWILVFDSPKQHPRLTEKESEYLEEAIGDSVKLKRGTKAKTPWRKILYSKPFWAVLIASQGLMWGTITLSMQTPTYFNEVHHLDIKKTGFLSGIPEIGKFFFAIVYSTATDKLIRNKSLTVTSARKIAVAVSEYIPANFLILLGFMGYKNNVLATILLTITSLVGGASSSGSLANIVDLSPNHAGTLLGIIKTLTIIPGVISPLLVTYLTSSTDDKDTQWKNVFMFVAIIYIFCSTIFLIFGSGDVQPWNADNLKIVEEKTFLGTEQINEAVRNKKRAAKS